MGKTIVKLKVVEIKERKVVFEDSREVAETAELLESENRGFAYVNEMREMIEQFQQSPSYSPTEKKKLFGKTYKYDYLMNMESVGEPLPETPTRERTRFEKFLYKHTTPPEGFPWINLRAMGWHDLIK